MGENKKTNISITCNTLKNTSFSIITILLFILTFLYVYSRFYYGSAQGDGPLISNLIYKQGINPMFVPYPSISGSFYQTHFSPIFSILSLISYITPFNRIEYFAIFQSFSSAILGATSFALLYSYYMPSSFKSCSDTKYRIRCVVAILCLSFFLSINSINLKILEHDHFENWIPILSILFLYLWLKQEQRWSYLVFILLLIIREDAGFHFFGMIFLTVLYKYYLRKDFDKKLFIIGIVAFLYSCLAIYIQKKFFPGDNAFTRVYIDFNNAKWLQEFYQDGKLRESILTFFNTQFDIYIIIVLQVIWSIVSRNFYILLGLISCIPWIALHFFAKGSHAIGLGFYTSFPVMITLFYPLFAHFYFRKSVSEKLKYDTLKWKAFVVVISLLASDTFYFITSHEISKPLKTFREINNDKVDTFAKELSINKNKLGNLIVTSDILGIHPKDFKFYNPSKNKNDINTLIYYSGKGTVAAEKNAYKKLENFELNNFYKIKGTNIRVASTGDIISLKLFSNIEKNNLGHLSNLIMTPDHSDVTDTFVNLSHDTILNLTLFGRVSMPAGNYCVKIKFKEPLKNNIAYFYLQNNKLRRMISSTIISSENTPNNEYITRFTLDKGKELSYAVNPEPYHTVSVSNFNIYHNCDCKNIDTKKLKTFLFFSSCSK